MKYYLYDDNKKFCGESMCEMTKNYTDVPVKPTFNNDIYFLNNNWEYNIDFYNFFSFSNQIFFCIYTSIMPKCGDYIKEKSKDISILIPCFGKAAYIEETVFSCINQTLKPYEIIILLMDKDSQEKKEKLESFGKNVRCIINDRENACKARTHLVNLCKTEYFVFLDGDDLLEDNFLEETYKAKGSIVFTIKNIFFDKNIKMFSNLFMGFKFRQCIINSLTILLNKEAFYEIGLDEELCIGGEDTDFIISLFEQKKWYVEYCKKTHYNYRQTTNESLVGNSKHFDSHVRCFIKHKDFILKELIKSDYKRYEKTINFLKNWDGTSSSFYNLIDIPTTVDELKNSYNRKCLNKFNEDDYILTDKYNEDTKNIIKNKAFDAYIFNYHIDDNFAIIRKDIKEKIDSLDMSNNEKIKWLINNYCCILSEKIYPNFDNFYKKVEPHSKYSVSFSLHKECNKNCIYCYQKEKKYNKMSDDEIFESFDEALTKIEKLTNKNIEVSILGGEPTIWSNYLIEKILNRLENYNEIYLFTNHVKKDSLWENNKKVIFYNHLTDWYNYDHVDTKQNEIINIILTHKDVKKLDNFLSNNKKDNIVVYEACHANNEELKLTKEDIDYIISVEKKYGQNMYTNIFNYFEKYGKENYYKKCLETTKQLTVDCSTKEIVSCCGINQKAYSYEEFNLQKPCLKLCKGCEIIFKENNDLI